VKSANTGLKRLAKLYGMVENLHAMQVRAAAGAVDEVERAAQQMSVVKRDEVSQGRAALARGSRVESMAVERTATANEVRRMLLERIRAERRLTHEVALDAHRMSRLELRQIEGIVERVERKQDVVTERRAQGTMDDRFLSRREWMRARAICERG
jgi:hypothetical protein